ncbi:hypothetical protein BGX33_009639 [Mortierella sp. NVP41]|nr:hypothetical protein BGX33_009639 [Mortierella sp. NVP41]
MSTTTASTSPFGLPELRHRLSRFLSIKDALSCTLVSQAWTKDFVSAIWFMVDFDVSPSFTDLLPDIVATHGHHIRVVKNAKSLPQVQSIANASVNRLRELRIDTAASVMQHILAYEIVSTNITSLETLELFTTSAPANKRESLAHYVPAPSLAPFAGASQTASPSKLKVLRISHLCLTYDGLMAILQGCTNLSDLELPGTDIVGRPTRSFQHTGVTLFSSGLKSVFSREPVGPSLLPSIPNLKTLQVWDYDVDETLAVPAARIKEDLYQHCPHTTGYRLSDTTGAMVPFFSSIIAKDISDLGFLHHHTSLTTITAILLHQATLKTLLMFPTYSGFNFDSDEVPPVLRHSQASGHLLQLIPRHCSQLETLDLHLQEMEIGEIEMSEWACKNLRTLRIRIKGLDTKDKILKTIALWRAGCWRHWQKATGDPGSVDEQGKSNQSIEARVARHLLKFDKLGKVWLGYQTWTPV